MPASRLAAQSISGSTTGGRGPIAAAVVALDWQPAAADVFAERLGVMMSAGVPEDVARQRAAECARDFCGRHRWFAAQVCRLAVKLETWSRI